ncbi:MAG: antibiotic biosynthesis monooxygenase [Actinomycetota bacterium]|jgi:heme-degrading monooxygenase HmoA|nr:antibiotic biosynthesis monooxygenase [Actinomycetota bacterium]
MYEIFWEYEVHPGQAAAFESLYGADGEWASLFREAEGYVETLLFRDADRPTRYLTIDRWRSRAAFDAFIEAAGPAYAALDRRGDALTLRERRLGAIDA